MPLPLVECSSVIYRAVLRAKHIQDEGRLLGDAFLRRPTDAVGISVCLAQPPEDCFRQLDWKAVVSLHVGFVRDLELVLDIDEPNHANLIGLPYETDLYDIEGRRKANRLAQHARFVLPPKQRNARAVWERFQDERGMRPSWVGISPDARSWQARFEDGTLRTCPVSTTY